MAERSMSLIDVVRQCGDQDLLRQLAEATLAKPMEFEVAGLAGAGRHERSGERTAYRNGYRERTLDTRLGTLELAIPRLRSGSYFPSFLEPRRLSERALAAVIQQAWVGGASTRKMDELVKAVGCEGISKSQVSELRQALDERVGEFLERPLGGGWPCLWLDATYLKVRQGGRVISVAAIIATGVNPEGRREILGLGIGLSEAKEFWVEFLRSLVARGLPGVQPAISDSHAGLKAAIAQVFGAAWQRCRAHFTRNLQACVPRDCQGMVAALAGGLHAARPRRGQGALAAGGGPAPRPVPQGRRPDGRGGGRRAGAPGLPGGAPRQAALHQPAGRLNKEVKRRTDVVGIFPNEASIKRLVGAVLMEQNDEWIQGKRYMTLETMAEVGGTSEPPPPSLPA